MFLKLGCAVLALAVPLSRVGANVVSSSGVIVQSIPGSVIVNAYPDNSSTHLFIERENQTITGAFSLSATTPGTWGPDTTSTQWDNSVVTEGPKTRVSVYLLHADSQNDDLISYAGSIRFSSRILGTNSGQKLTTYDSLLGLPTTVYPSLNQPGARALEMDKSGPEAFDEFTLSADMKTLSYKLCVSGGIDEVRIVTAVAAGDANGDGAVSFDDLLSLAQHYGTPTGATWEQGDFNFDGAVNFDDLLALAQNYGAGPSVNASDASPAFEQDWTLAMSLVPEPGTIGMLAMAIPTLIRRRR